MYIYLCDYNIHNGRERGVDLELRELDQANMDLWVLFEMNIVGGVYTRRSLYYNVLALEALGNHQGGVALLFHGSHH